MTPEQVEAIEWLKRAIVYAEHDKGDCRISDPHRATIRAMLAEPRMPEKPTEEMMMILWRAFNSRAQYQGTAAMNAYNALRAELLKPKTKEVEGYRVEYSKRFGGKWFPQIMDVLYCDESAARMVAQHLTDQGLLCIRVTGPHKQEVPA